MFDQAPQADSSAVEHALTMKSLVLSVPNFELALKVSDVVEAGSMVSTGLSPQVDRASRS